jgi:carbamoyl-phosphate synthase large subunit
MRVMMSAAGSPASISILRHLRSLGHFVVGIDASAVSEALGRGFCDEFHRAPAADTPGYLEFLCERLQHVDLFLPFIDEELVAIALAWNRISPALRARIAVSDPEVVLDCVDKVRFQAACARHGLPIAPVAGSAPAFFKPRFGRGGKGVIFVDDERLFVALHGREGVLQQAIAGQEYTVDALFDRDGALVAVSPRQRLRATGVSTAGTVAADAKLHELAAEIGRHWRFRYAVNFQVVRDPHGVDWLIELNPRLAGSAIFSTLAGCDPFAGTIALWSGEAWSAEPRPTRVYRYWQEYTGA